MLTKDARRQKKPGEEKLRATEDSSGHSETKEEIKWQLRASEDKCGQQRRSGDRTGQDRRTGD